MRGRLEDYWKQNSIEDWDDFWGGLWTAISSELAQPTRMTSASIPMETVTVETTILSTTFVTVPYSNTDAGLPPAATMSSSKSWTTSTRSSSTSSSSSSMSTTSIASSILETILPPVVTASSQLASPSTTLATSTATPSGASASNSTADSMIGPDSQPQTQKKAVVGGLSGTIAGLIFVGALICLILRIRRKKHEPKEMSDRVSESESEKGCRPLFLRTWTGISAMAGGRNSPAPAPQRQSNPSISIDEEHHIIRMNTRHWPRPYAPGAGEGYRESVPRGQLCVMNPDVSSRPMTPRRSSDTPNSFLKKPRSALTGFVFGAPRSQPQQQQQHPLAQTTEAPTITMVDPALSRECIAPYARTPSFMSYPSVTTSPNVRYQTPEDPFYITPHPQSAPGNQQSHERHRRPSIATLQSAAGVAGRLLHPFRSRQPSEPPNQQQQHVRGVSHFSVSTSASRSSRRSDPFDLDRPSVRASQHSPRMGSEFSRRSQNPNWILYEGT